MTNMLGAVTCVLVALVFPLAMLAWYIIRRRGRVLPYLVGVATFLVSQVLVRIPLMNLASQSLPAYSAFMAAHTLFATFFASFTAGIFEEGGRWLSMRLVLRKKRGWADALAFGLGHGGVEAMLFAGLPAAQLMMMGNLALAQYGGTLLLGAVERVFAMVAHVAFSIMVMAAVRRKKPLWLLAAVCAHGLFNFVPIAIGNAVGSVILIEVLLGVLSVPLVVFIVWSKRYFTKQDKEAEDENKEGLVG